MPSAYYRFRVRVEAVDRAAAPVSFEIDHHDDILAIVERVRAGTAFSPDDAGALAIGLKLFSEVALVHRQDPLFADIQAVLCVFIGNLKSRVAANTNGASA